MKTTGIILLILGIATIAMIWHFRGAGSFRRLITRSGIYSVCKPDGYPVVCFLDADGHDGGLFCMPVANAGGACLK